MKKKGKQPNQAAPSPTIRSSSASQRNSGIDLFLLFAYLLVHFIPAMSRLDSMAPQWFYLAIVDTGALIYLHYARRNFFPELINIFSNSFSLAYLAFVIWAGFSWFYAINPNEMIVCFARLLTTFIAFINISLLLSNKKDLFLTLAYAFLVIVAYESIQVTANFLNSFSNENLDELILALSGNAGNKNITAASIVIKLPFLLFIFDQKGQVHKGLSSLVIFLLLLSLFILNARASYLSVAAIVFIFAASKFLLRDKETTIFSSFKIVGSILGLLILTILLSIYLFNETAELTGNVSNYSNPIKRVTSISITNEGSSGRLSLWSNTLDFFKAHPLIGAGFGNWKIASIPYEKEIANDFSVAYHTHNDFLEIGAELGIIGLLFYGLIFYFLFLGYFKKIFSIGTSSDEKQLFLVGLMALTSYFIDAVLNFPMERSLTQLNFIFAASIYLTNTFSVEKSSKTLSLYPKYLVNTILLISVTFSCYINAQVDQSYKGQSFLHSDLTKNINNLGSLDFEFPQFPSLAFNTMPIKAIIAQYKIKEKDYSNALILLDQAEKENPYLAYSSFLKTVLYNRLNNQDSIYKYARITFEKRPRSLSAYQNWVYSCYYRKDSLDLDVAFKKFTKFRDEPEAWKIYFSAMFLMKQRANQNLISLADSAIKKFPDSSFVFIKMKKDFLNSVSSDFSKY